jgi:glycosyltransferase involved in cell wall biosynthesis
VRVCFLIDYLGHGGTETQLLSLIRHLDRSKVQPYLVLLDGEGARSRSFEPDGVPILRLGVRSLRRPSTMKKAFRFAQFLQRERIDVVQCFFPDSTYFGTLVAKLVGVPRLLRTRFNLGYWMSPTHRWLARLFTQFADGTLTNCEACRQAVIAEEWPGADRVWIMENGIEFDQFAHIAPLTGAWQPKRRVGLVANLRPIKGPTFFIEAVSRLAADFRDVTFHIAGEGELRPQLESMIESLGLTGRLVLEGALNDVPSFLAGLEVAVLCSRSEGMPNAVMEYMAAGRAIVATAVGGTGQLIDDGVHGLLVPPENTAALSDAIRALLTAPDRAARLGAAARERARQRFTAAARARRFEDFYTELVRAGHSA